MKFEGFLHVNIRCSEADLPAIEKFYGEVLGLRKGSGAADFRGKLKRLGVEFEEQNIENAGYQVFLYDPVGTKLEFNFLNEQVEDAVALGTLADTTTR
ncbi:MAG: hypothetical protein IT529_08395 [Burkholderiales bacterium]|nr:hypothetical protein [Burkholderiales bacterium]